MLLIILYIKIAFWYVTLSGNACQLSSLNRSEDGVYNFTSLSSNVELQLPQIIQQKSRWGKMWVVKQYSVPFR